MRVKLAVGVWVDVTVSVRVYDAVGVSEEVGVEVDVGLLFDEADWTLVSDTLIFHGRRCCHAKKPACGACPVAPSCPSFGIGPTDPVEAGRLVKTGEALR